jgi:hypothetical protein
MAKSHSVHKQEEKSHLSWLMEILNRTFITPFHKQNHFSNKSISGYFPDQPLEGNTAWKKNVDY